MKFNKEKHYRPLMIFMMSLLVLSVVVTVVMIFDYSKDIQVRNDCKMICELSNMDYEGVKDGWCACTSSVGVRVYVDPSV